MTPRSFFTILLKIMGLYLVLGSVQVVPELVSTLAMFRDPGGDGWGLVVVSLLVIFFVLWLFYIILRYCLFETDWIIDKLSLDKHFTEEKFELNIHRSTILTIAVIVIGGITFIEALPMFVREVYNYFGSRVYRRLTGEDRTTMWVIFYAVKTLLGYLLMTNSRVIVNFIERERSRKEV